MVEMKAGLEIHQQLDSNKLFCNCPSVLRSDNPKFEIRRRLHAVAGESGEVDAAALHEAFLDKEFVYYGYDTTCLVELDEEPPHLINKEALEIALHIAIFLNCKIIPITQIMRKTVVDGSNTSGFQRTVLIAKEGYVETSQGRVRIENVYLEEDAARPVSDYSGKSSEDNIKVYRLDRLGIPLIEIQTAPDIKSPEQAKETALFIGDILRSCKVKRGIGTIRQDVNVSIPAHPRIEIKGFQDVKMFVSTIEKEIKRQEANLKSGGSLKSEVRNALLDGSTEFLRPMPGSSRMYPETDLPLLRITREIINKAKESLPKTRSKIKEDLKKRGLDEDRIKILLKCGLLEEFESLLKLINEPRFIFKCLIEIPKEIASHSKKSYEDINEILTIDAIETIINAVREKRINRGEVKNIMEKVSEGKSVEDSLKVERVDLSDVESEIAKIVKDKPGLSVGGYMGLIMERFKGKINGKEANDILKKLVKS